MPDATPDPIPAGPPVTAQANNAPQTGAVDLPEPPPAAAAVLNGKTEREAQLERDLEEARQAKKKAETDASYHADENRRLKDVGAVPPKPTPKKKKGGAHSWTLIGAAYDEED